VILPITSSVALIDARTAPTARAPEKLEIEQTLDDRKPAALKLEIRTKGRGLIPALADVVDLSAMKGFEVTKSDDHGMNIAEMDASGDKVVVVAERSWTLDLAPRPGLAPTTFTFPTVKAKAEKSELKRYADADIVKAEPTVAVSFPAQTPWWQLAAAVGLGVVIISGVIVAIIRKRSALPAARAPLFTVPEHVTAVNAIATLRKIASVPQISFPEGDRVLLITQIDDLERRAFAPPNGHGAAPTQGELTEVVSRWVAKAGC